MARYIIDHDAGRQQTDYLVTDTDGSMVIHSVQDAQDIVDHNARMAEHLDKKQDWWFIGSIPLSICHQWSQECGAKPFTKEWQKYATKQVQLPEYRKLNPNNIKL